MSSNGGSLAAARMAARSDVPSVTGGAATRVHNKAVKRDMRIADLLSGLDLQHAGAPAPFLDGAAVAEQQLSRVPTAVAAALPLDLNSSTDLFLCAEQLAKAAHADPVALGALVAQAEARLPSRQRSTAAAPAAVPPSPPAVSLRPPPPSRAPLQPTVPPSQRPHPQAAPAPSVKQQSMIAQPKQVQKPPPPPEEPPPPPPPPPQQQQRPPVLQQQQRPPVLQQPPPQQRPPPQQQPQQQRIPVPLQPAMQQLARQQQVRQPAHASGARALLNQSMDLRLEEARLEASLTRLDAQLDERRIATAASQIEGGGRAYARGSALAAIRAGSAPPGGTSRFASQLRLTAAAASEAVDAPQPCKPHGLVPCTLCAAAAARPPKPSMVRKKAMPAVQTSGQLAPRRDRSAGTSYARLARELPPTKPQLVPSNPASVLPSPHASARYDQQPVMPPPPQPPPAMLAPAYAPAAAMPAAVMQQWPVAPPALNVAPPVHAAPHAVLAAPPALAVPSDPQQAALLYQQQMQAFYQFCLPSGQAVGPSQLPRPPPQLHQQPQQQQHVQQQQQQQAMPKQQGFIQPPRQQQPRLGRDEEPSDRIVLAPNARALLLG